MAKTDYEEAYRAHIGRWGVGATLRGAREAGGETIQEVASALRIRAEYIHALEVEDFQRLPGWAYALSFVRTYGEYLGLEPLPLVRKVREQFELRQHLGRQAAEERAHGIGRRIAAGIAVILAAGIAAGWYVTGPAISLTAVLEPVPRGLKQLIDRSFFTVADTAEPAEAAEVLALGADMPGPAPEPPAAFARPVAPPLPPAPARAAATPAAPLAPAAPPAPSLALDSGMPPVEERVVLSVHPRDTVDREGGFGSGVFVRARGPVHLTIEDASGGVLTAQQLDTGERYRLPTGSGNTMSADDAGALEVYVEGALAGLIGPAGQRVSRFPVDRLTRTRADG